MDEVTARHACETYSFHGQLGLACHNLEFCRVVQDTVNPDVWSSNKAYAITARTAAEIALLMRDVDELCPTLPYRHFVVDPFTPPAFTANATLTLRAVETAADWVMLRTLVLQDYAEGGRTQGKVLSETVTDGIIAGYRAKKDACQFFIAELEGQACAYGSGLCGPNNMGMVEDLFTLPAFRKRGIASSIIARCVDYCRDGGSDQILIGSHANELPKHLYHRLGFEPVCLTRDYIKQR